MKRHNLLAVLIFAVAVGACALRVELGDADADTLAFQPFPDFDAGDEP